MYSDDEDDGEIKLEDGLIYTRLNETVRNYYVKYLEKQLQANLLAWKENDAQQQQLDAPQETLRINCVKECVNLLEDIALKSCQITQLYQRSMVKIIESIRCCTAECRLEEHLKSLISTQSATTAIYLTKATQTNNNNNNSPQNSPCHNEESISNGRRESDDDFQSISLQQKIEMFQKRIEEEQTAAVVALRRNNAMFQPQRQFHKRKRTHMIANNDCNIEVTLSPVRSPIITVVVSRSPTPTRATSPKRLAEVIVNRDDNECLSGGANVQECNLSSGLIEDDQIAKELAQIFNEEKTELDVIFGIDPNEEPDDPCINSILREIENAKLPYEIQESQPQQQQQPPLASTSKQAKVNINLINNISVTEDYCPPNKTVPPPLLQQKQRITCDLRNSLWPCELFMQRRRLAESLNRLIEEDFRWHEIMKWKFEQLFGEDSDDEFAVCSPSIELNETLISSCIRRISPWLVKHLMKPLRDGLIANRYLFKKLAKKLAHTIIMDNQYPNERAIMQAIENYFCLHQACLTVDDLENISNIYH